MGNPESKSNSGIKLFTIGFAKKNAREFFKILQKAGIKRVVDIRLNNVSQLAGFTKKGDLEFFLQEIAGIKYIHCPEMAPTKEIFDGYKSKKFGWPELEKRFSRLMIERGIEKIFNMDELDHACLLCSEPEADKCHRSLVAKYLKNKLNKVEINNL